MQPVNTPVKDQMFHRTFRDYALIVRERIWYIITVFAICVLASFGYTLFATKVYEASSSVRLLREDPKMLLNQRDVLSHDIRTAEDFNTQVQLLGSESLAMLVADKLTPDLRERFLRPYEDFKPAQSESVRTVELLQRNCRVSPVRLSLVIRVFFKHPDKELSALVANLYVEQFIAQTSSGRNQELVNALEDLKAKAVTQQKILSDSEQKIQAFKEKHNMVSLDQRKDIVTEKLKNLNTMSTAIVSELKTVEVLSNQIKALQARGESLLNISAISQDLNVKSLIDKAATLTIEKAKLAETYRPKHPIMLEAAANLAQTQASLVTAANAVADQISAQYNALLIRKDALAAELKEQEQSTLSLDRMGLEYQSLVRESDVNRSIYQNILESMKTTAVTQGNDNNQNVRIVDRATTPLAHSSPRLGLNLVMGASFGGIMGLSLALFLAFIDDRVKSRYDIESILKLNLLAIVPHITKMSNAEKAKLVLSSENQTGEAFKTLHAELNIGEISKSAKTLLITSTQPSEGKSLCAANLALTFAINGQRTLLIDLDLRKPNVHREFEFNNDKGAIQILTQGVDYKSCLHTNVHPNLHVLTTGGQVNNAPELLNRYPLIQWIESLKKDYDRIIIDTPPLAVVSDAQIIMPAVDGVLFVIRFNTTPRKAAEVCLKKIQESKVPLFGGILNDMKLSLSGYYYGYNYAYHYKRYSQYYNKP